MDDFLKEIGCGVIAFLFFAGASLFYYVVYKFKK